MEYTRWRDDVFGQSPDTNPVEIDLHPDNYAASPEEQFDHIDRALGDAEIHRRYSIEQIGIGLQLLYSNSCSSICYCYLEAAGDQRRVHGIRRLEQLYANYFDIYCKASVGSIGNDHLNGGIGYLCYMFWDIFVLYPKNASATMITAAFEVMVKALEMSNDNCIVSAIHGLGHWAIYDSRSAEVLTRWLKRPSSRNPVVLDYAHQATSGCIQ